MIASSPDARGGRRGRAARVVPAIVAGVVLLLLLRPILLRAGVPEMNNDWAWPLTGGGVRAAMLNLSAPVVSSNWAVAGWFPRINAVQPFVLALNLLAPPAVSLKILLLAIFALAASGAFRAAKAYGARDGWAALAAAWYLAAPFVVDQLVAGHLWILVSYAALPHAVEAFLTRRRWYAGFFWIATTACDVHFLGFDAVVMLALGLLGRVPWRCMAGGALGLLAFAPMLAGGWFASTSSWAFEGQFTIHAFALNNSVAWLDAVRGKGYFMRYDLAGELGPATWLLFFPAACAIYAAFRRKWLPLALLLCGALPAAGLYGPLAVPMQALFDHVRAASVYRDLFNFLAIYQLGALLAVASIDLSAPVLAGSSLASVLALWPGLSGAYGALLPNLTVPASSLAGVEAFEREPGTAMLLSLPAQTPIAARGFAGGLDPLGLTVGSHGLIESSRVMPAPMRAVLSRSGWMRDDALASLHFGAVLERPGWISTAPFGITPGTRLNIPEPGVWQLHSLDPAPSLQMGSDVRCVSGDLAGWTPGAIDDFADRDPGCGGAPLPAALFNDPRDGWAPYDSLWFAVPEAAGALPGGLYTTRAGMPYPVPSPCDPSAVYEYHTYVAGGARGWIRAGAVMRGCAPPTTAGPTVISGVRAGTGMRAFAGTGAVQAVRDGYWFTAARGSGHGRALLESLSEFSPWWGLVVLEGRARVLSHLVANGYFNAWEIDMDGPFAVLAIYWPALAVDAALIVVAMLYAAALFSWSSSWKQR